MAGYSTAFIKRLKESPNAQLRKLGLRAIKQELSIKDIAEYVGVSRTAIYDYFTGRYAPEPDKLEKLVEYIG